MSRAKAFANSASGRSDESSAGSFGEGEQTRQEKMSQTIVAQFIWLRLALTLPVMALAPVFLLLRGAPRFCDALTFALLLMPLTGVTVLRRSGSLENALNIAQSICVGAMILLGVTLTCANGALGVGAVACFLLALLEAAAGAAAGVAKRVVFCGAAIALAAVVALALATSLGFLQPRS